MSLELPGGRRSPSPASSGRSTPAPREARRTIDQEIYKGDKSLRRYGATIERALSSWEISPQEWADYIAFLGRLLKAIQNQPKNASLLPHSDTIASKLAQCLNPALPSGVHQKAIEVYTYIFTTFGPDYIANHLHDFLPGLSSVLSFASLSVRPGVYELYEHHVTQLSPAKLRPVLKSLILSLLPAIEDETSEDFEHAFRILESLDRKFSPISSEDRMNSERDGYFWQSLFLAVVTSPTRRQGALNYLTTKLPRFSAEKEFESKAPPQNKPESRLSPMAEAVVSPEPGLLIRCFACGLSDSQTLIQRGFLDLLVSSLPLDSPLLQARVRSEDLDRLVSAAIQVLLRREMSLNRRLWSWFLGPDPKASGDEAEQPASPNVQRKQSLDLKASSQLKYFSTYGRKVLERCVLATFRSKTTNPAHRARPFRICLSLMDRWEIGGSIIPQIFLPAIENAYEYSRSASVEQTDEMIRSASLFFDGIEASLIWESLTKLVRDEFVAHTGQNSLEILAWVVRRFNINDEEMLNVHIPYATVYLITILADEGLLPLSHSRIQALHDTILLLVHFLPETVFHREKGLSRTPSSNIENPSTVRKRLDAFYEAKEQQAASNDSPFGSRTPGDMIYHFVTSLLLEACTGSSEFHFVHASSLLLSLQSKTPKGTSFAGIDALRALPQSLMSMASSDRSPSFPTLTSMISLMTALSATQRTSPAISKLELLELARVVVTQIWPYLSPDSPKYNVEAVKAIWQLQDNIGADDSLEASITALVREGLSVRQHTSVQAEAARRFTVLWNHTIPANSNKRRGSQPITRKGSTMPTISDAKQTAHRQDVLTSPLMLVLDTLDNPAGPTYEIVRPWLRSLSSLDQVLGIHFDSLGGLLKSHDQHSHTDTRTTTRVAAERLRNIEYNIGHVLSVLKLANEWIWQSMNDLLVLGLDGDALGASQLLAEYSIRLLRSSEIPSVSLQKKAVDTLDILLAGPYGSLLKTLDLDSRLIDQLMDSISAGSGDTQGALLDLIGKAMTLRLASDARENHSDAERRTSIATKRPLTASIRQSPNASSVSLATMPPPQLFNCLKMGFSADVARPHLDQWLAFLSRILPTFSDAIFTSIIPLVECLCAELEKLHATLVSMSKEGQEVHAFAPEGAAMALLEALEMVLARAHECLANEQSIEAVAKPTTQPRGILGNMASGVFKSEAAPTKTAQANSRLTVILTFQDAIRVSMKLWAWACHSAEIEHFDKASAATTTYNALKLRNRTRYLLEQIFDNEPLESLEVLIFIWSHSTSRIETSASLDLLHVMQGMRPKNVVPTILDSICSRTNLSALPVVRQSSQTIDLSAVEIAVFLYAYLQSIEDDAMDEVWSDSLAFLRDVLSNPLPYRQVLPSLLSIVLLLAQKIDNTNFGEQRKMRRELGDVFLRLLGATFTTMPSGYILETDHPESNGTASNNVSSPRSGRKSMGLAAVLNEVTANLEVILETSDRILNAINSISSNLISPMVHAKSFPNNTNSEVLALFLQIAKRAPSAKPWKKDLLDAFNDPRLMSTTTGQMENDWFPLLYQWCLHDKERMPDLLSRLTPPSTAGIMFGVGASAARQEADRRTQMNLRRVCILLLCSPEDTFVMHSRAIEEKLVELFEANPTSSPSALIKAELFMVCRALVLSTSAVHLAPTWPIINENLQAALMSLLPSSTDAEALGNLSLLQACKLLDLLIALSPDEFQLHEWLYITDTIDAVYQPPGWNPTALSDHVAETLASEGTDDGSGPIPPTPIAGSAPGRRRPLIDNASMADIEDIKASTKDDFARAIVRPFLSQLSLHAYEGVYSMESPDVGICRRILLEDVLDLRTVVE